MKASDILFFEYEDRYVRMDRVKAIKGSDVIMTDGILIPLSQKKAAVFRRTMNTYMGQITGRGRDI